MSLSTKTIRLASRLRDGDPLRKSLLRAVQAATPDYLPREGKKPFEEIERVVMGMPRNALTDRMQETVKGLQFSVDCLYPVQG